MTALRRSARACGASSIIVFGAGFVLVCFCRSMSLGGGQALIGVHSSRSLCIVLFFVFQFLSVCVFSSFLQYIHILKHFCVSVLFVFLACLFGRVNTTLKTLCLDVNRVGDAGASALAEALHVRQSIRSFM